MEPTIEPVQAFERLKDLVSRAPALAHFDPNATQILETDSSSTSLVICLKQRDESGVERILGFGSRCLNSAELRYCICRKELLGLLFGLRANGYMLEGRNFIVRCDNRALACFSLNRLSVTFSAVILKLCRTTRTRLNGCRAKNFFMQISLVDIGVIPRALNGLAN